MNTQTGRALLARADALLAADPRRAAVALRRETDDAALASAALTQAESRRSAVAKFGADAARMFFTRDGLEQASRAVVSDRRARRVAAAGAARVADLCCGIGSDAFALVRQGLRVLAVDSDPATAAVAAASARELGLGDRIEVRCADALATDLSGMDAVFADPARRVNGRRIFDPARYVPPLPALWEAAAAVPLKVGKVGPGIDHAAIPDGAEAEWVSVDGSVVEAALWSGFGDAVRRRATVIGTGQAADGPRVAELTGDGEREAEVGDVGEYLYEPDGAVIRAHLVAELADGLEARLGHEGIAYLYADKLVTTPFATAYRIGDVLPFHVKRLREALRQRGIGRLTIKKRGADVVPEQLRTQLRPSGDGEATLVVTRLAGKHVVLLCQPVATPNRWPTT
nr:class I SAM-dependent methyltransferase [Stackebrandtia nassauensis]